MELVIDQANYEFEVTETINEFLLERMNLVNTLTSFGETPFDSIATAFEGAKENLIKSYEYVQKVREGFYCILCDPNA